MVRGAVAQQRAPRTAQPADLFVSRHAADPRERTAYAADVGACARDGDPAVSRFITYLPLPDFASLSAEDIIAAYREVAGPTPLPIALQRTADTPHGKGYVFTVAGGLPVTVMFTDEPLPPVAWASAAAGSVIWPEAAATIAATRAYVMIALVRKAAGHAEALAGATAVTLLAGALTGRLPVAAMIFAEGNSVTPGNAVAKMAAELGAGRKLPVLAWVGLSYFHGEMAAGSVPTAGALTTGLRPFVGREVEVAPAPCRPVDIARWLIKLSHQLIVAGPVLKDATTVAVGVGETASVRCAEEGMRPGVPVYQLRLAPERSG